MLNRLPQLAWMAILFVAAVGQALQAQDDRRSELGEKQRLVQRKMEELEGQIILIAEKIAQKEPERAARLKATLDRAKEQLIVKRMSKISELLDARRYDDAEAEINAVVDDLEELVRLLLNAQRDKMTAKEEIDFLEQMKREIQKVLKEQKQTTRETQKVSNKEETLKDLDAKIQKVKELMEDQQKVIDATDANADQGARGLDRVADQQYETRKKTEDLAKELSEAEEDEEPADGDDENSDDGQADGNPSDGNKPSDGKPSDGKPSDGKPSDGKPSDGKPSAKPSDGKPSDGKPSDGKPSDGKPSDGKPSDGKPSDGKPSQNSGQTPKSPGQQPLEQASQNQQKAENNLGRNQPEDAKRDEQNALENMQEALDELEKERKRIASLPPEVFDELARKQRRTRGKTEDLAKQMKNAKKPSGDEANEDQPKQTPGQQNVQNAQQAMEDAAGNLEEDQPEAATRKQEKAEEELEKALKEIEQRLNQLREETREEKLARLEARFSEMLNRQKVVSSLTLELNDKKASFGRLRPRDVLALVRMATEEMEIRELGQQAYDLLLEDGTSIVFPEMVVDVQEDLATVAQLLQGERTDQLTQMIQLDIESVLQELLDALKQAKKQGGGGGGGGGGGKQPLLRKSAELKMLRAAQLRVNRRTLQLDMIRGESGNTADDQLVREIENIAIRQGEVAEMTRRVMEDEGG